MTSSGSNEHRTNRLGCAFLSGLVALILLVLIAVSLGWLGQIDRNKISGIPAVTSNR